jgi:hypothetical protein
MNKKLVLQVGNNEKVKYREVGDLRLSTKKNTFKMFTGKVNCKRPEDII